MGCYRIIAQRRDGAVRLWSRNAHNWAPSFPRIVEAMTRLTGGNLTLDGEAVCLREDGRADFHALRSKRECVGALLIVFDLLALDGQDFRGRPLTERRERLRELLDGAPDALWYSSEVAGHEGPALFRHACGMDLEGIVSKRVDSRCVSGRFDGWRKIKCPQYTR